MNVGDRVSYHDNSADCVPVHFGTITDTRTNKRTNLIEYRVRFDNDTLDADWFTVGLLTRI